MENTIYPWRRFAGIGEALAFSQPIFVSLRVVEPTGGYSEAEIAAAERRLSLPFPADVRQFFHAMRPTELFASDEFREFGFYPLTSPELAWRSMEDAEPSEDWSAAHGLALGQSDCGDPFWWVRGHRSWPDGSILLLDHAGSLGGEVMFVHFARSFAEFIAKVAYFKNLYSPTRDPLFEQEYRELNPSA